MSRKKERASRDGVVTHPGRPSTYGILGVVATVIGYAIVLEGGDMAFVGGLAVILGSMAALAAVIAKGVEMGMWVHEQRLQQDHDDHVVG